MLAKHVYWLNPTRSSGQQHMTVCSAASTRSKDALLLDLALAGCPWINKLAIDRFRFGLQWCLAKAVEMGLDIAITPHLDDGLEYGGWRNALWFNPLQKYGGFSYYDVSPHLLSCKPTMMVSCKPCTPAHDP